MPYLYRDFKERHPEYDLEYWLRCRAFYAGGKKLLENEDLLKSVFPKHAKELEEVYQERCERAFYIPYAGEIVDAIVAALTAEEIKVKGVTGEPNEEGQAPENPDPYYADFYQDVSPPGGKKQTLNQLLRQQILTALQCRTAWTLIDLPAPTEAGLAPVTELDQQAMGLLDAYACPVAPEDVVNWEDDASGELLFAMIRTLSNKWGGLGTSRNLVRETYTFWTRTTWERYYIEYEPTKPPADSAEMVPDGNGNHTFGRVPLPRLTLPEGLWAMSKIESLAREHFNKRNAVSWSQLKNLLPVFYAKVAASPVDPDGAEGVSKLLNQPYGPGRLLIIGEKDELSYAQPDSSAYASALEDLNNLRDEMHRVLHHMALSVDNSGAALQRSADSKAIDQAAAAVVLRALGGYLRELVVDIMELIHSGRADKVETEWEASGADDFSDITATQLVEQAMGMENISIPSKTFQIRYKTRLAKAILGKEASEKDITEITKELEGNITEEQFDKPSPREEFDAANAEPPPGV